MITRQNASPTEIVVSAATKFAKNNPIKITAYFLGLAVLLFAKGFEVSSDALRRYKEKAPSADVTMQFMDADALTAQAYGAYRSSKGWFFTCDDQCTANWQNYQVQLTERNRLETALKNAQADANAEVGLFSEAGVGEAKALFWSYVSSGKSAAKRATTWDFIFVGMRSLGRDEGLVSFIIEMVIRFLFNLIAGIFISLTVFLFAVWQVIMSYRPDWFTAILFFCLTFLMASSFFVSVLLGIAGGVGVVTLGLAAAVNNNARLRDGGNYTQRQTLHRE